MDFLAPIITVLDFQMTEPTLYGWFHLLWLGLTALATILLCHFFKEGTEKQVRTILLVTSLLVIALEIYKQFNYSFSINDSGHVVFDYQWYAFPWQFCSTPMFLGLAAALTKGRVHNALCAYLATFALFADSAVMLYPGDVFTSTMGISIQTMICHGSMIVIAIYLFYTQYVKSEHKTIFKAISVFAITVGIAMILNEVMVATGAIGDDTFNMFYISRHFTGTLPIYSTIQPLLPYPVALLVYILGFGLAAYLLLLASIGIRKLGTKKKN